MKCGRLFKFGEKNLNQCVLNHRLLFFVIFGLFCFLITATAIGYHCTILTDEEEKALKQKIEFRTRKREEERRLMMLDGSKATNRTEKENFVTETNPLDTEKDKITKP